MKSQDDAPKRQPARRMTVGRQIKRLAILLGAAYLSLLATAWGCSERLLFRPRPSSYGDGPDVIKLQSANGARISATYLPNSAARYTILFSHGNAEDMGHVRLQLEHLRSLGFSVLAYDYQGYGTSEGKPSEANCYADIEAAYEHLTGTMGVPPDRIIVHGRSVGGGPSVDLASKRPVAALVLESAFTSAFRVVWVGNLVPGDRFRNINKIGGVRCPVLVMHGKGDFIVPFRHGPQLFRAANEPKRCLWVKGAGHNDLLPVAGEDYDRALLEFARLVEDHQQGAE